MGDKEDPCWKQATCILICYLTLLMVRAHGQAIEKKHVGQYGNNEGICLFEDGQFVLHGYATAVFGTYELQNNDILFYPHKFDLFDVYGVKNLEIGEHQSQWTFIHFEEGETYARFDQDSIYRIFNEDANCFNYPYSIKRTHAAEDIVLINHDKGSTGMQASHYTNTAAYNDFVVIYNKAGKEYEDFVGRIQGNKLVLSNYGGSEGYPKNEEDTEWEGILQWKSLMAYRETSYKDNQTQTEYHKLPLQESQDQASLLLSPHAQAPIFYSVCDNYLDLDPIEAQDDRPAEAPFHTDKPDGFY